MLGSGWRVLDILEPLEQDLQVPVVHAQTAGRLLAELPPLEGS